MYYSNLVHIFSAFFVGWTCPCHKRIDGYDMIPYGSHFAPFHPPYRILFVARIKVFVRSTQVLYVPLAIAHRHIGPSQTSFADILEPWQLHDLKWNFMDRHGERPWLIHLNSRYNAACVSSVQYFVDCLVDGKINGLQWHVHSSVNLHSFPPPVSNDLIQLTLLLFRFDFIVWCVVDEDFIWRPRRIERGSLAPIITRCVCE